MRKIKFRGQREDNKEWVYGFVHTNLTIEPNYYFITTGYNQDPTYVVDNKTIDQYTGLKDKNGVEIYEGDVLRDGKGEDGVVVYFSSIGCFMIQVRNVIFNLNENDPNRPTKLQYTEVIGNIHENKEELV